MESLTSWEPSIVQSSFGGKKKWSLSLFRVSKDQPDQVVHWTSRPGGPQCEGLSLHSFAFTLAVASYHFSFPHSPLPPNRSVSPEMVDDLDSSSMDDCPRYESHWMSAELLSVSADYIDTLLEDWYQAWGPEREARPWTPSPMLTGSSLARTASTKLFFWRKTLHCRLEYCP